MKLNFALMLCWLGIHRYRIISSTFGFGSSGSIESVQCKICRIKKIRKRWI